MSRRRERYEVVRTDAGWIARHISSNGNEVARSTNVYARERGAVRAVELMAMSPVRNGVVDRYGNDVEVRLLDERTAS